MNTIVIMNGERKFAVNQHGTKWSSEFADADKFRSKKEARKWGKLMTDSVRPIYMVTDYGLQSEDTTVILGVV